MIGQRVRVVRKSADAFEGTLLKSNSTGVVVHNRQGLNDRRVFIPYQEIIEIVDLGRAP